MNIQESLLHEFKDEQKFKQLGLRPEQIDAWIMVGRGWVVGDWGLCWATEE